MSHAEQLQTLQAIFPDWDEQDLQFALSDAKNNVEDAVLMISEGRAQQFTTASKKKAAKPKDKALSNRNADTGGWGDATVETGFGKPSRGGRGGSRGGRGGRGSEPIRGGRGGARGGRGGARGGRGGFSNTDGAAPAWGSSNNAGESSTTPGGWGEAAAAEPVKADEGAGAWGAEPEAQPWDEAPKQADAVPGQSKGDDFASSGGWGDAPAAKEVESAAKSNGNAWQAEIDKPVPVAQPSAPVAKPKLTWAQIAKPAEKPKPVPPPAPVAPEPQPEPETEATITSDEPVAQDEVAVTPEALQDTTPEPVDALGDAPAQDEVEAEAEAAGASTEAPAEEQPQELLPEETAPAQADKWETDPAIAGSGAQKWAEEQSTAAPEPPTTYQGPPGFSAVASKAAPGVQAGPRSNSRAAQRYKEAEGQGVVLPASVGGVAGVEMQFGSLSFGGLNGDGVDSPAPEPKQEAPQQAAPIQAQPAASPVAHTQPPAPTQQQAPASTASQPPAPLYQQQQPGYSAAPTPHQTLQQQMQNYQYLQQQQAPAPVHSATPEQHAVQQQQQAQNQFYRGQDYYSPIGSHGEQAQQQQQAAAPQPQPQASNSPYEPFGAFGQQSRFLGQQANQHVAQGSDSYGAAQRQSYDSYGASGYPRPPVEEPKPAATPSHPTAGQLPHQQSGYYSGMGNMGYYQQGPYNPYYQYGQAPQAGFQQYYPIAGRGVYGQPAPQPAPAPIPAKPQATQSPYGGPSPYPAFNSEDSAFGGLGRYDAKPAGAAQPNAAAQTPAQSGSALGGSYGSQGLHGFLGMNNTQAGAARPQGASEDNKYGGASSNQVGTPNVSAANPSAPNSGIAAQQAQAAAQAQAVQQQQQQQRGPSAAGQQQHQPQQAGQQGGFGSYPYGGGYGGQDWGQYGGHYAGRGGYSQWQQ
ncbi:hypothetical protein L202_06370 [Cryptococcus amylolentus CBS 6039]|uniref:RNA polymerase II degradation factor 1 n=1 Tax=Cryptococcus amylolentus CBS 6039 TaxID=1295533 RepID=A0A1E3HFP1_9TREE|nr:hypothetical protein L202_06370 [Cryptococcus amylolentus CBS 6039]ODN75168.1 hypothetical protein L202_06370 [Cryptococcus amylolentus CBS 6039]